MYESDEALRCFAALPVPDALRRVLREACAPLREAPWADGVRWVPSEQLHVTLRFFAALPAAELPGVVAALDACAARAAPVPLEASRLTGLPSGSRARVLVAAIETPPALASLVADLESTLDARGHAPERRRFRAHVTVGRVRRPPLRARVDVPLPPCPFVVREIVLLRSHLERTGARYEPLHAVPLD